MVISTGRPWIGRRYSRSVTTRRRLLPFVLLTLAVACLAGYGACPSGVGWLELPWRGPFDLLYHNWLAAVLVQCLLFCCPTRLAWLTLPGLQAALFNLSFSTGLSDTGRSLIDIPTYCLPPWIHARSDLAPFCILFHTGLALLYMACIPAAGFTTYGPLERGLRTFAYLYVFILCAASYILCHWLPYSSS